MRRALMLVAVASVAAAELARGGDAQKDLDMVQGKWKFVSIQVGQIKNLTAEDLKDGLVTIKGDAIEMAAPGKAPATFKMTLHPSKAPKYVDMLCLDGPAKDRVTLGIYKMDGKDSLVFCISDIGDNRPAEFVTREGTKTLLMTLKRAK